MRFMSIPAFSKAAEITDLATFYKTRLASGRSTEGTAGMLLLGFMIEPNDEAKRDEVVKMIREWVDHGENGPLPPGLETVEQNWLRIADIVHFHYDIAAGEHQEKRGGASVGKAIYLIAKQAKSKGTGQATLWDLWATYKNVAHLIAAAVMVAANMHELQKREPLGLTLQHLHPFRITLLMPELIIGLAITIERYGLQDTDPGQPGSMLDPETLWRIPTDIGVNPVPLLYRKLRPEDIGVLNARRAGNRGKRHRPKGEAEVKEEVKDASTSHHITAAPEVLTPAARSIPTHPDRR